LSGGSDGSGDGSASGGGGGSGGTGDDAMEVGPGESDDEDLESHVYNDLEPSPLHEAVEAGDLAHVQALLTAGADVEEQQRCRQPGDSSDATCTPLHRAAQKGFVAVARCLVERGANKEATTTDCVVGNKALHIAAENGHVEVARMLIDCGANKDAVDSTYKTALTLAAVQGHVAVAEYLLEQGCDVNHAGDGRGGYTPTPLHHATLHNRLEVAQALLRCGAGLNVRPNFWRRIPRGPPEGLADFAAKKGHHAIADAIRDEETRRSLKRDRSAIEGAEEEAKEGEASKRPRVERDAKAEPAPAAAAAAAAAVAAAVAMVVVADEGDGEKGEDEEEPARSQGRLKEP